MYVEHLTSIFGQVKRVLKPEGSLWLNLGDKYAGAGNEADTDETGQKKSYSPEERFLDADLDLGRKSLCLIPERVALSLVDDGWILRNKIVWAKQVVFEDNSVQGNAMPSSVKDRVNTAHEYLYHFVQTPDDYYYDLDSIRRPYKTEKKYDSKGANIPDVWQVNLRGSDEEHFAVYPENLVERPIKATCPPKSGVVLDPFAGRGTTLKVAAQHGRNYTGIEINPDYVEIAEDYVPNSKQMKLKEYD